MILITGATGNFGKAIIDFLLEKGARLGSISALVRERKNAADLLLKGIIVRIGDYNNYATIVEAFEGVDKLLLASGTNPENREKQHEIAIKAAKEAGVKQIFYTGYEPENETEKSSGEYLARTYSYTVKLIKESGIPYTIFRYHVCTDTMAFTLRNMADATANILLTEGHKNNKYFLSNPEYVSLQIADALADLSGKRLSAIADTKKVTVFNSTNRKPIKTNPFQPDILL